SVVRRPPASLKVIVREVEPVALVALPRGNLVVVDAGGAVLPFDPARVGAGLDLPVVLGTDTAVVGVLARIQALDPALFRDIDAARRLSRDRDDVLLEYGPHRVLLTRDAGPEVVQAVALVTKDLAARARRAVELDARYAGQIVVRRRAGSPRA
ncbi:MAG: cell division protein FtsQ/DivIB, partial [Myxococcota bacterium]